MIAERQRMFIRKQNRQKRALKKSLASNMDLAQRLDKKIARKAKSSYQLIARKLVREKRELRRQLAIFFRKQISQARMKNKK